MKISGLLGIWDGFVWHTTLDQLIHKRDMALFKAMTEMLLVNRAILPKYNQISRAAPSSSLGSRLSLDPTYTFERRFSGECGGTDRLLEEFMIEASRKVKYIETLAQEGERISSVDALKKERQTKHGKGPLTPEEMELLDKHGGHLKAVEIADNLAK